MAAFDALLKASFLDYPFPVQDIEVRGGLRDHVHEYPHAPGGAPEKLGRKLYEFTFTCPFLQGLRGYPKLWPETLATLRVFFEGQNTGDLVVPTIGTIQAYCTSWNEKADAHNRSGVLVTLTFREDQSGLFLVDKLIQVSATSVATEVLYFGSLLVEHGLTQVSIFRQIQDAANAIAAILDLAEVQGDLLTARAEGLVRLCTVADGSVAALQQPVNVRVLQSMHRLWLASQRLTVDALGLGRPLVPFTTPATMTISDVSRAIYGDNSRAMDLLRINAIPNPFAIPAGFPIRAYAIAA